MKKKVSLLCVLSLIVQLLVPFGIITASAEGEAAEYQEEVSPSVTYNMNIDWKYKRAADNATFPLATALAGVKDTAGKNFYEVGYDDSSWETVSLPHAVNADDSFDGLGVDAGEAGLYRGFMFYRKNITVPATDAGKKFILEFEAFRQSVYVYVNGTMAGYYEAGISAVGFDLTDYIRPGEENVIAVATDNASDRGTSFRTQETKAGTEPGSLTGYGYQWNTKDFNEVQGGLTGNVKLYAKNKIYQTLPLYSNMKTTGNYIYGSNFDFRENSADITVEAEVRNETAEEKTLTLRVDIVDSDGKLVKTFESLPEVVSIATDTAEDQFLTVVPSDAYDLEEAGKDDNGNTIYAEKNNVSAETVQVSKITASANVSDLKFWSDVSPNLYTVYTYLKDGQNIIDSQKTVTGFREVVFDKDKGLLINGVSTYLKGYAQRSTNEWAAIGVANDWLSDIDMQLVKESNANFIRWMHIAPNPVDIRAGDKYGVVSICPAGDKEGDTTGRAWDQRLEAMRDTIIYYRNSPSILFWEAGNNAISAAHMKRMTELRKELDPNGDRMMGCRTINTADVIKEAEWAGTMLYRHDANAYASMQSTGNYIPILETEYHRNEAPRRVWDDYSPPYYDYVNKWLGAGGSKTDNFDIWDQTQEDFSRTMFNSGDGYSYYYNNRVGGSGKNYYSGAAMMVWSDSNMHVRNCGVENARTSGRVDPIRIKKESFYAIQAAQSSTPKVHILGHWNYPKYIKDDRENGNYWYEDKTFEGGCWTPNGTMLQRDPTKKTVYVIGSEGLSKVELYVNDELVGTDTTPTDNFIYAFEGIDVTQSGKVSAKAYDDRGAVAAEHEIKTAGEAATIRLTPRTGPDFLADGADLAYVDVEVVDAEGNVCPLDERKITFSVSDNNVAKFIGGYNSGYYSDGLNGAGGRIVNHKDYVFAECGINRVFVQSTRNAGKFTLTATAEGMQPVSIELTTKAVDLTGGLTTTEVQSIEQGAVPTPIPTPAPEVLKPLGEVFTADWTEGTGNVEKVDPNAKDWYTVTVNGTKVEFANKYRQPFKPDSSTGVVGEVNTILDAIKAAGASLEYTFNNEGDIPNEFGTGEGAVLPYIKMTSGANTVYLANGATVIVVNGEKNLTNYQVITNDDNTALIAELGTILGNIEGVSVKTDDENLKLDITVVKAPELSSADGAVTVKAGTEKITNANLIMAGYDENGALVKVTMTKVNAEKNTESEPFEADTKILEAASAKAMLWSEDMITPLCGAVSIEKAVQTETAAVMSAELYEVTAGVTDVVTDKDTVASLNDCNTAVENMVLSDDTSPDGTKYLSNTSFGGTDKYQSNGVCMQSIGLGDNSKADIMWEADVRFNDDGSGITPYDQGDKKLGTCIRRHGTKLAIQTGSKNYEDYCDIDPAVWYHIVLIGRYSAADAKTDMIVYKYDGAEKTIVGTYPGVNQRNLSANNNNGASHWNVHKGTSVDNLKITLLGADTLNITADTDEITAGNTMQLSYGASRLGEYITSPAITWEIYNAENTAVLNDANITITSSGILNVGIDTTSQKINVRATAASGIYASKEIDVKAVDISSVKFDSLTLTATKDYVSADEPLTITAAATKNGVAVTLEDSDLIWYVTDSTDMVKLGDNLKWIKIENGKVTVDPKVVSQDITIRAADPDDKVRGSISVHIKSSDALEGDEDGTKDRLLFSSNGESAIDNTEFIDSVDGTHAYKATAGLKTGNIAETNSDIVVEMDIKFTAEGAGFQPGNNAGNLNTCVIYRNNQLAIETSGGKFTYYCDASSDKWYHITLIRKQGAYAHMVFEEYDENGERTNRKEFTDVSQRNDKATALININAGTAYDNLRILAPVPTDIKVDTDVKTVFAGNTVQATSKLLWNGLEMKNPDASMFEYKIYDANNEFPRDDDKITVDANGLISIDATLDAQDVWVRAVAKQSGKYASVKFTVASSDIITINKLAVDENNDKKLVSINVTKNFFYSMPIAFVVQVFGADGAVKETYVKSMYGDALKLGENKVSLGIDLPLDFDKTNDKIKIYAVTKVSQNDDVEPGTDIAVVKTQSGVKLTSVPQYDANTDVVVLVIKNTADIKNVMAEDILFFDILEGGISADTEVKWAQSYTGGCIVQTAGKVSGVHKVYTANVD